MDFASQRRGKERARRGYRDVGRGAESKNDDFLLGNG